MGGVSSVPSTNQTSVNSEVDSTAKTCPIQHSSSKSSPIEQNVSSCPVDHKKYKNPNVYNVKI
jgi:hypothetical protein